MEKYFGVSFSKNVFDRDPRLRNLTNLAWISAIEIGFLNWSKFNPSVGKLKELFNELFSDSWLPPKGWKSLEDSNWVDTQIFSSLNFWEESFFSMNPSVFSFPFKKRCFRSWAIFHRLYGFFRKQHFIKVRASTWMWLGNFMDPLKFRILRRHSLLLCYRMHMLLEKRRMAHEHFVDSATQTPNIREKVVFFFLDDLISSLLERSILRFQSMTLLLNKALWRTQNRWVLHCHGDQPIR